MPWRQDEDRAEREQAKAKTRLVLRMIGPVLVLLLASSATAGTTAPPAGPGPGPWRRERPEQHGLSSPALAAAAAAVAALAPQRQCLLVVKDGALVHESYAVPGDGRTKVYETDSLGKIFTAGVVGAAVQRRLLGVDRPLAAYGVRPSAPTLWNRTGVDYWPNVTARHLLTQMSGYGLAAPGSLFSYDSDAYIQHLSAQLRAVARQPSVSFARTAFAEPLGVPRLFDHEGSPTDDISAGGGQMASCEDIARVGQLLLNRGRWRRAGSDEPLQLMDENFVGELMRPAAPGLVDGYGFLAWLNHEMGGGGAAHCCGPRWIGNVPPPLGRRSCGPGNATCGVCCAARPHTPPLPCDPSLPVLVEGARSAAQRDPAEGVTRQIIGDSFPPADQAPASPLNPPDMAMAMGAYAKYLFVVPSLNVTVVSMGLTFGELKALELRLSASRSGGPKIGVGPQANPPAAREAMTTRTLSA